MIRVALVDDQPLFRDGLRAVLNGVEATRRLRTSLPECKVLVLTTFDQDEWVFDALRAGAVGYLLKDATGPRLREAVAAAARGESFLQPSVASKVLSEWSRLRTSQAPEASPLTEREADVIKLLVRGRSNKEIAAALFLAEGTVKNHVTAIFLKLEVTDRTQAAVRALERGWA
jgi:DNA-binding NarL/FixJ family response regulator